MDKLLEDYLEKAYRERTVVNHVRVVQGGRELAAFDRHASCPRDNTWSATKSVVGVAAGIAIDEGLITLDEHLCDSFEAYMPKHPQPSLGTLTVRDMLTMTTGLSHPLFFADSPERYTTRDWIKYFFENGDFALENGARFLYSNFNTYMVSCLIEKKAGQNLLEYLTPRLFEPIGVNSPEWTFCPMMHVHAANGWMANIQEFTSFGLFMLHKGEAGGKQLVSRAYMEQAMSNQLPRMEYGGEESEFPFHLGAPVNGYGYQFWIAPEGRGAYASGKLGQVCLALPEKDAVIAVMSNDDSVRFNDIWTLIADKL